MMFFGMFGFGSFVRNRLPTVEGESRHNAGAAPGDWQVAGSAYSKDAVAERSLLGGCAKIIIFAQFC